jgi:hypothetical protein
MADINDMNGNTKENTVSAENQLTKNDNIQFINCNNNNDKKILIIGNSITRHGPKADIKWNNDWGMAASAKDKDYVHILMSKIKKIYKKPAFCIAQMAEWEMKYWSNEILYKYNNASDFKPDIIIIRICENVNCSSFTQYPFKNYYQKLINYFKVDKNAEILLTNSFWQNNQIDYIIKKIAEENSYKFVDLNDLGKNDKMKATGLFEHSGVAAHPNDIGMQEIAQRIFDSLFSFTLHS